MNMKIIGIAIAIIALWIGIGMVFGPGIGTLYTAMLLIGSLAILKFTPFSNFSPIPAKWAMHIAIVGIVLPLFLMGTLSTLLGQMGLSEASFITSEDSVAPPVMIKTAGECTATSELMGKTSTPDVLRSDGQSNSDTNIGVTNTAIYVNGVRKKRMTEVDYATFNAAVGDSVSFYGGNASYYGDALTNVCIENQRPTIELVAHKVATESDMEITCYGDDATTALTTGTTNEEDYELALVADEDSSFYCKIKNAAANAAFDLCAIATLSNNDVEDCKLLSWHSGTTAGGATTFKETVVPIFLKTNVKINDTNAVNVTDYDRAFRLDKTQRIQEFEWTKWQFEISADATNNPAADDAGSTAAATSVCIVQFLDCNWAEGKDGKPYYDFYAHTDAQTNVGMSETILSPYGKETGVIIEAT